MYFVFNFVSLSKRFILANHKGLLLSEEEINADKNSSLTLDLAGAVILGTEP